MKPISTLLALASASAAAAAAQSARVYTFDTEQQQTSSTSRGESLSADTARLILSQRLGSSQYSQLGDVDESVLEQLNKFGGAQQSILGAQDGNGDASKLLIVVEGVDKDVPTSISEKSSGDFVVDEVQDDLVQESLIDNLLNRKTSTGGSPSSSCSYDFENDDILGTLDFNIMNTEKCPSKDFIFFQLGDETHISLLQAPAFMGRAITAVFKIKSQKPTERIPPVESAFHGLSFLAKDSNQESTIILLPSTIGTSSKNSTTTTTGTKNKLTRRSAQSSSSSSSVPSSTDIPSTLLPICHTSNSTCTSETNNCSGHGTCYKKYSSSEDGSGDCYACRCERTVVRKNDDGTVKTVQWGGPACQKKDVSVPFWLLAGFTVLLVSVISWAIGLMYSVGSEELPSVIGAGVSGGRK